MPRQRVRARALVPSCDLHVHLLRVPERVVDAGGELHRAFAALRVVPYERTSGWSSKASDGVEWHLGRGLKARGGRRDAPAKVLKDRRSPRERRRMGTSA
eukprot:31550-Pelagococcus_subviridis.AAC.32